VSAGDPQPPRRPAPWPAPTLIMAFILAPLAPAFAAFVLTAVSAGPTIGLWMAIGSLAYAYGAMVVVGIPALLVLRSLRVASLASLTTVGFVLGAAAMPILEFAMTAVPRLTSDALMSGAFCGATAAAFWLLARPVLAIEPVDPE
jgi:hypothetical protein